MTKERAPGIRVKVRRSNLNDGYLITPNELFRGTDIYADLTVYERMYLGAGLSCSDDYDTTLENLDACIKELGRDKREQVRRRLREAGFLTLSRVSDGQSFVWALEFFMDPLPPEDRDVLPAKKDKPAPKKRIPPQLREEQETPGQATPSNSGHGRIPDGQGMSEALDAQGLGGQGDVNKEEKNHLEKNQDPPRSEGPVTAEITSMSGEGEDSKDEPPNELSTFVAWFARNTPWPALVVEEALASAVTQGRGDLRRCATALRELAEGRHGHTSSPRRLLKDGPWWAATAPPKRDRRVGPRCKKKGHEREPAEGCVPCLGESNGLEPLPVVTDRQREAGERALAAVLQRRKARQREMANA